MPDTFASSRRKPKLSISLNKLVFLTCLLVIAYFGYGRYAAYKTEQTEAAVLILTPEVNDLYFFDLTLLGDKLARKSKYQLAKVVRVTEDNLVIVYGRFFYQWQYAVVNSIKHGDLSNHDYFSPMPDYIPFSKIKEMKNNGVIYLVKRPIQNRLYGNFVSAE